LKDKLPLIGITMGDPAGIGPEMATGVFLVRSSAIKRTFVSLLTRLDILTCKLLKEDRIVSAGN